MNLLDYTHCASCPLHDAQRFNPVPGYGNLQARLIVVGEAPGPEEARRGLPFVGASGRELDKVFRELGVERKEIYCANSTLCFPQATGYKNPPPKAIQACRDRLVQELLAMPNRHVIVTMGSVAAQAVMGRTGVLRLVGRAEWSDEFSCFVVYCTHPAYVLRNRSADVEYEAACRRAVSLLSQPLSPSTLRNDRPEPSFTRYDDPVAAVRLVEKLLAATGPVACDIETDGLDFKKDQLLEIGFSVDGEHAHILPYETCLDERVRKPLRRLLEGSSPSICYHNGIFDVRHIRKWLKIEAPHIGDDTLLLHYALDERSGGDAGSEGGEAGGTGGGGGYHDLKGLAGRYCNAPVWNEEIHEYVKTKKDMFSLVPVEIRNKYHAYDCCYTLRLYHTLKPLVQAEPPGIARLPNGELYPTPWDFYRNTLIPASNFLADITFHGVRLDKEAMIVEKGKTETQLAELALKAEFYAFPYTTDWIDARYSLTSPKQTIRLLYNEMGLEVQKDKTSKKVTSNMEALRTLQNMALAREDRDAVLAVLNPLVSYREMQRFYTTYLKGMLEKLDDQDHIHTDYKLHGSVSRLSSSNPNLQNIPRGFSVKQFFRPGADYVWFEADYKNLEMRVACWYSRDEQLAKDLVGDIHWQLASDVFKELVATVEQARAADDRAALIAIAERVSILHEVVLDMVKDPVHDTEDIYDRIKKRLRFQAKFIEFGWLYGRGAKSMADATNGMNCEVREAQLFIDRLEARYPRLGAWRRLQQHYMWTRGWVEGATGRRRRIHKVTSQQDLAEYGRFALNAPIQGKASDLTMGAAKKVHEELVGRDCGRVLLLVHDALGAKVRAPEEKQREAYKLIKRIMISEEKPVMVGDTLLVFEPEIEIGPTWGEARRNLDFDRVLLPTSNSGQDSTVRRNAWRGA
jgi:DNA polymerase